MTTTQVLFLPCAAGVEPFLVDEVQALTGGTVAAGRGGVSVAGNAALAMRLNLESRLAQRVLWRLAEARYRGEDDLYALARGVRWHDWITPKQTLRVDTTARSAPLRSLNFASLRVKDAVCDAMRDAAGARPDVDTRNPDQALVLHLDGDQATLYVDTSGRPLFKRGWRSDDAGDAPLKETLAAALLAIAGWRGRPDDGALFDPCCGSGTIAIEAAQIACGRAPGLERRFAFERLAPLRAHAATWRDIVAAARARVQPSAGPIVAGDVSLRRTDVARRHAERAGVADAIAFKAGDMLQRLPPAERGTMVLNPPYGERLAPKGRGAGPVPAREQAQGAPDMRSFFAALAAHWKRHYAGWSAWILSPDPKLPAQLRLKESRRAPLWNGPIECRLFRFDMVAGSARRAPIDPAA